MEHLNIFLWAIGILQVLDAVTTYRALTGPYNLREGNGLLAAVMEKLGVLGTLLGKLAIAGWAIYALYTAEDLRPWEYSSVFGMMLFYMYIVNNNLKILKWI